MHRRSGRVRISSPSARYPAVVAIPARDERDRIADCLRALALQDGQHGHAILLLLNNTTDGTAEVVRALMPRLPCPVHLVEHHFAPARANAGEARRLAMSLAAHMTEENGVVLTSDADGRVAPDWMEANRAALDAGADAVCGRAVIDPEEALLIPAHLHAEEERVCDYAALLDEIHGLLDPDPADPWPRHTEHSGASIAVRKSAYLRTGGIPAIPSGEDRAFLDLLRCIDARIRHAPEVSVTVSGRIHGRAAGGMADTIRRRMTTPDTFLDDGLEPARDCARRAHARQRLFRLWHALRAEPGWPRKQAASVVARTAISLVLPPTILSNWLALPYFGTAWSSVEAASPALLRRRLRPGQLETEMRVAETILSAGYAANMVTREPVLRRRAPRLSIPPRDALG